MFIKLWCQSMKGYAEVHVVGFKAMRDVPRVSNKLLAKGNQLRPRIRPNSWSNPNSFSIPFINTWIHTNFNKLLKGKVWTLPFETLNPFQSFFWKLDFVEILFPLLRKHQIEEEKVVVHYKSFTRQFHAGVSYIRDIQTNRQNTL